MSKYPITVCPCGEMIESRAPLWEYIKWLWAHRKHNERTFRG